MQIYCYDMIYNAGKAHVNTSFCEKLGYTEWNQETFVNEVSQKVAAVRQTLCRIEF